MATPIPIAPVKASLIEVNKRDPARRFPFFISTEWSNWLQQSLVPRAEGSAQVSAVVVLTGQAASIGTTPVPMTAIQPGLYRVSWYLRVTQAATTSSSIQVTLGWTDGAVNCSRSGAAETGNTTSTTQSGEAFIRIDGVTPINYSTTYASVGGTPMKYRLDLVVELVS
jgi:hypothetical protein